MSSGKLDRSGVFQPVTLCSSRTCVTLDPESVYFRKNGIEFLSPTPIPAWTEMTVDLRSPVDGKKIACTGVAIACTGSRTTGYVVAMVFLNLTPQAQQRLESLAVAS